MNCAPMTRRITVLGILDAETEKLTRLIRSHRRLLIILPKCVVLWIPFGSIANTVPSDATLPAIVFTCIVSDGNLQCTILPLLFGEKPWNIDMSCPSISSPCSTFQHMQSNLPSMARQPWGNATNSYLGRSRTDYRSTSIMPSSIIGSGIHSSFNCKACPRKMYH